MGWDNSEFFLHCLPGLPGRTEPRCPPYTAVSVFWRDITPLICLTSLLPSRCYLVTSRINHLHSDSGLRCASRVPRSRQQDLESATPPEAGVGGSPCPLSLVSEPREVDREAPWRPDWPELAGPLLPQPAAFISTWGAPGARTRV